MSLRPGSGKRARCGGGTPVVHALKPVDLTIESGDWLAVIGPSGSGKSTLLNLLGLLDRPTRGQYVFAGHDVSTLGPDAAGPGGTNRRAADGLTF